MAMACGRCGKTCADTRELVTHDCPRAPIVMSDIEELVKMIDESMQKIVEEMNKRFAGAAETIRQLGGIIDEQQIQINALAVRLEALEAKRDDYSSSQTKEPK